MSVVKIDEVCEALRGRVLQLQRFLERLELTSRGWAQGFAGIGATWLGISTLADSHTRRPDIFGP